MIFRPRALSRSTLPIVLLLATCWVAPALRPAHAAPAAAGGLDRARFIGIDEIKPGQKATCRTVFEGRTIEEFTLEIAGVVKGGKADGDMILARAEGPRLAHDGIAAGMSGSPIYIDGRLAGALAFGWPFSRDALCGITPIADMLDVMAQPDGTPTGEFTSGPGLTVRGTKSESAGLERLRTPLMAGGLSPAARAWLAPWAEENGFLLAAGGVGSASSPAGLTAHAALEAARAALVPGAAVSVDLMRGDMNLSAIGTLTWRDGDKVAAFGHPFFQTGPVAYPLGLADIVTIVASDLNSFKMGSPAEQVGVITQDRRAAIAGHLGDIPHMLPLTVSVHRPEGSETYRYEILRSRLLAPTLAGLGVVGALTTRGGSAPEATWRWRARLVAPGVQPLVMADIATGQLTGASTQLSVPLGLLLNNPFAAYDADSLTFDVDITPGISRAQVVSASIDPRVIEPGGTAHVTAELRDYRGASSFVNFDLTVPEAQPEGRLIVAVAGGPELDRQEAPRLPGRFRVSSLPELVERLAERRSDDRVYAALYGPGVEASQGSAEQPQLPVFAQRLLASDRANRPDDPFGNLARLAQSEKVVGAPVDGLLTLALDVRMQSTPNASARAQTRAPAIPVGTPEASEEDRP